MRVITILLLMSVAASATAAVYKWKRPDGSIVYSDHPPTEGATPTDLPPVQEIKIAPPPPSSVQTAPGNAPQEQAAQYTKLAITEPEDDSTIRDNAGNLTIKLAVEPDLQEGDNVALLLDGKEVGQGKGTTIHLPNVDRGTHTLQVEIRDAQNNTLISSSPITIHLLRFSALQRRP